MKPVSIRNVVEAEMCVDVWAGIARLVNGEAWGCWLKWVDVRVGTARLSERGRFWRGRHCTCIKRSFKQYQLVFYELLAMTMRYLSVVSLHVTALTVS